VIHGIGEHRRRLESFFAQGLWRPEQDDGLAARLGRQALQVAVIVAQGAVRNHTLLRASALTYFTMLSLIPLLALAIGLVNAFGDGDQIVQMVAAQIGAVSPEAGERILELVRRVDFGSLGAVGGASLFFTTVLALSNVEKALNFIWGVERQRSLVRRVPDYLAVLVVAPLLVTVALSLATSLRSEAVVNRFLTHPALAELLDLGLRQAPALLFWVAFAFLYWFLPNTTVRAIPALAGGLLAAVLFTLLQGAYVGFQLGAARANALFGSFAALPILLVWIYFSWAIVLLGSELAFAIQNRASFRQAREGEEPVPAEREAIGLAITVQLARSFQAGEGGRTAEELADALDVPVRTVRSVLAAFEAAGLVAPRGDPERDGFQLGRAAEAIHVGHVLVALRGPQESARRRVAGDPDLHALFCEVETKLRPILYGRTLAVFTKSAGSDGSSGPATAPDVASPTVDR
jgi:membrane protein